MDLVGYNYILEEVSAEFEGRAKVVKMKCPRSKLQEIIWKIWRSKYSDINFVQRWKIVDVMVGLQSKENLTAKISSVCNQIN